MKREANIAIVILTLNESAHLPRALEHIKSFAREIFIVDSFSEDETVEVAKLAGAKVLQHPFQNQAQQFNWALDHAPITSDWVMRLDADEIIEADLAEQIVKTLPSLPSNITGINLNRKTIFQDRFIRHGGRYPLTLLRIWRRGKARVEDRWMDEHVYLTEGTAITLKGGFADHSLIDLTGFIAKHNAYASREAVDVLNRRLGFTESQIGFSLPSSTRQARVKRLLKESVYNRLPFELASLLYFLFRYVIQLGFLDGRQGFTYHVLQGFWYRFLVGIKVKELEKEIRRAGSMEEMRSVIARISHLPLD